MSGLNAPTEDSCDPQAAAELLRALAHPMRLQILCRLLVGELAVGGFESELGLKQPNLSQQLGQLREAGLVTTRREAKAVFYRLADERVRIIMDALRHAFNTTHQPNLQTSVPPVAVRQMLRLPATSVETAPTKTQPRAATECGVFSVAGWAATDGKTRAGV
jgi:DNA-binding transcriptional ArsR family regulator